MHLDCTLFSDDLKQRILEEISRFLKISTEEIVLQYMVLEFVDQTLRLEDLEKKALLKALSRTSGNISKASKLLGVSRKTVYSLIKKYEIVSFISIIDN